MRSILFRLRNFFRHDTSPPAITVRTRLADIADHYPNTFEFLRKHYNVTPTSAERKMSLGRFCSRLGLPPAQILYMQIQMDVRDRGIARIAPRDAQSLVARPETRILDVRETWELHHAQLPRSQRLDRALLDTIIESWPRDTPVLVYCHHGIRSGDAAAMLKELGFTAVHVLQGGIDGWSLSVDPGVARYEGAPC